MEIGPKLELIPVLTHEAVALAIAPDDGVYVRDLWPLPDGRVKIEKFYAADQSKLSVRTSLGYAILARPAIGVSFKVAERHPIDPTDKWLITNWPPENGDDEFLAQ